MVNKSRLGSTVLDPPLFFPSLKRCRRDPPPMERKDNLPRRLASSSTGGANLTSSSSSSYSSSASPPDFIRQVHAVLKHRRPLGVRAVRVLDQLKKTSKSSDLAPSLCGGNAENALLPIKTTRSSSGSGSTAEMDANPPNDSSLTPPSLTSALTGVHEDNVKSNPFGLQKENSGMLITQEKETPLVLQSPLDLEPQMVLTSDELKKVQHSTALSGELAFQKDEDGSGIQVTLDNQNVNQQDAQNMEVYRSGMPFCGTLETMNKKFHSQHRFEPATQSAQVFSSCVTTISVHSGPASQFTCAPLTGKSSFPSKMLQSAAENLVGEVDQANPDGQGLMMKQGSLINDKQDFIKREAGSGGCLESQAPSLTNSSSVADVKLTKESKVKAMRKKKYDPDMFFKVNGKHYQKLGKIGSGGSSEVHKVISADFTIYALKKIKLRGRDYATAYGFCQEIGYLNKLKGKNNIIQLIDYEVTDKTLLHQAMEASIALRDGRIKDDQYIYMVLEYGEIDLANMLLQKWKETDGSCWKIDENWLRFYWQQMLEAVNTIHEERIVHSDLKPANFLLVRGSLKLIDFGIAKAIMNDTTNIQRDAQAGTLNYMSPEAFMWNEQDQTGGTIKCGRPSDIWSLGCILYQMVYGKNPFEDYKTFWTKFKVITDPNHEIAYEPVSNPWLVDLMKRCLAWNRNKRWRIPQLLQHPFLVPPIPRDLPSSEERNCNLLFQRLGFYWNEPEVVSLCSELHRVVSRLEKESNNAQ
ncbi:hypothetical protein HPP92_003670 [Vanilla planifolia]|uniref:Protein kinase domain-containing protein n=1 Tax=Vanilla planifolia TaxID=51239 RepID=A0A835SH51_VANPL|nr:hypothetical protein HPP92_003670 [Vanilla planifolia]